MTNLLNSPLSEIVNRNFRTASVFEKYGLDFCCKGKQTLLNACENKDVETGAVLHDLITVMNNRNGENQFQSMPVSDLIDHIVNVHHAYARQFLSPIQHFVYKVATKHGERFPYMKRVFVQFSQLRTELENHMRIEEEKLFPLLKKIETEDSVDLYAEVQNTLSEMEADHDVAGAIMESIRTLTNNYRIPEQACATFGVALQMLQDFASDLHQHVHLENNILFPRVRKIAV